MRSTSKETETEKHTEGKTMVKRKYQLQLEDGLEQRAIQFATAHANQFATAHANGKKSLVHMDTAIEGLCVDEQIQVICRAQVMQKSKEGIPKPSRMPQEASAGQTGKKLPTSKQNAQEVANLAQKTLTEIATKKPNIERKTEK